VSLLVGALGLFQLFGYVWKGVLVYKIFCFALPMMSGDAVHVGFLRQWSFVSAKGCEAGVCVLSFACICRHQYLSPCFFWVVWCPYICGAPLYIFPFLPRVLYCSLH